MGKKDKWMTVRYGEIIPKRLGLAVTTAAIFLLDPSCRRRLFTWSSFNIDKPHRIITTATTTKSSTSYSQAKSERISFGKGKKCFFISSSEINLHNFHWNGMIARMSLFSCLFRTVFSMQHFFPNLFYHHFLFPIQKIRFMLAMNVCVPLHRQREEKISLTTDNHALNLYNFNAVCQPQML